MMRLDSMASACLGHGWPMLLAFTAAVLAVASLRRPFRRLFGAERAFQLWLLPPLAVLASQLPRAADAPHAAWFTVIDTVAAAASVVPSHIDQPSTIDWRTGIVLVWLAGVAISLFRAAHAQRRYRLRLRGAVRLDRLPSRYPVLHALRPDVGPSLVGAWRVRIVLPSDFFERYDAAERALILAHETIHARRGDGWWCLLAHAMVAVFWFHPLAWRALAALRQDQEFACDAAVLREQRGQRSRYARTMLKTQSAALSLPVGCLWSPRHPITERIAMLKLPVPHRRRRWIGAITVAVFVAGSAGAIRAMAQVTAEAKPHAAVSSPHAQQYQLEIYAPQDANGAHDKRSTLAVCSAAGKPVLVSTLDWNIQAIVRPETASRVRIDLLVVSQEQRPRATAQLHGSLGQAMHADLKDADGKSQYTLVLTPSIGCPAWNGETLKMAKQMTAGWKNI